jgi:hypothetical protein
MTDLSALATLETQESRRFLDQITPAINEEVAKYGDAFSWDYSISIVPTPQGMSAMGLFMMFMKNPLLGTGDIANMQMIQNITALKDTEAVARLVAECVQQLREAHAQNLKI